jgi:DNA-binding MurR/RpiR family transcriptional regulator
LNELIKGRWMTLGGAPQQSEEPSRVSARMREICEGRRLSPAQRRIARFLLDRGDEVVFLSSVDIADAVGVSQPSVTRFAFALGFDGFPEFRQALRNSLRGETAHLPEGHSRNAIQRLVDAEIRGLETLADELADLTKLERVSAALAASRPLPILGLRVSSPLASYVGYFAAKVLPDVRVLTQAGSSLADQIARSADAGAQWLLAIGLPRYPRDLGEALTWARERGLKVALITDQPVGPLCELADEVLAAPVGTDFAFDCHSGPAVLCSALLHMMLEALPTGQQALLEEFEVTAAKRRVFLRH